MSFEALKFTEAGKALQLRALDGESLVFTQIQVGEGNTTPEEIPTLAGLVSLVKAIDIGRCARTDTRYTVEGSFRNDEIPHSFYYRELGVFAADPDYPNDRSKDILYAYQNAYDTAEYISISAGEIIEKIIRVNMFVGEAESVSALIDSSTIFVTRNELDTELDGYATTKDLDSKAPKEHTHSTDDINGLQASLDSKAATNHTHTKSEITDFPDSLPANGGNADTFGGLNTGYFYIHRGDIPDNDCDNARGMGTYNAVPTTSNTPFSSYWHIVVEYASNGSWIKQTATQSDKTNPLTYYRLFINDGWGDWIKVNINNKPHITSVTATESTIHLKWLPVDNATKYAVSIYNGGTGYTTYSLDITDTEYTITGLTVGTEYYILVQAYINDAWTYISAADHIIARTNAFSSGTATATKENCPVGAWYGQYEEV